MPGTTYHIPKLSKWDFGFFRTPGPGLGNLFLPISRALIGQQKYGGEFVYPTIRQFKIGTYLRNEPDKRTYGGVFRGRNSRDWQLWLKSKTIRQCYSERDGVDQIEGDAKIMYAGLGNYFHELQGHHEIVSNWIRSNACLDGTIDQPFDIGVSVRLGDYLPFERNNPTGLVRLPYPWFEEAIEFAKGLVNVRNPKIVFSSDARPEQISKLVNQFGGSLNPGKNAITDMLNLSQARVLVSSRSTFAMWATYLGNSHAIWDSEFDLEKSFPERADQDHRITVGEDTTPV